MADLEPPDTHYLSFAQGWLDLGNPAEALAELARIRLPAREHPDVLHLHWRIRAEQRRWAEALEIARVLTSVAPDDPISWIDQSYALHELRHTREARSQLLAVLKRFPDISIIPYNLACYSCQLGDHQEAIEWLAKAAALSGKDGIKKMALGDADLQPLWPSIGKL